MRISGRRKRRIILASASKRRCRILRSCGIRHTALPGRVKEAAGGMPPRRLVIMNARKKAMAVAARVSGCIIIGVDTVVLFNGRIIGKPCSARQAKSMLRGFSGRRLAVYTGIFVIDTLSGRLAGGSEMTGLEVRRMPAADVERYFRFLGPYDKAGGFSIEGVGALLFDDIRGSYFNVLGLPMGRLQDLFRKIGLDLLDFI